MRQPKPPLWQLAIAVTLCAFGLLSLAGNPWDQYRAHRDQARLKAILSQLSQSDAAYSDLRAICSSHPKAWIFGNVDTPERKEAVRAKVAQSFGEDEACRIVALIRLPSTRPLP